MPFGSTKILHFINLARILRGSFPIRPTMPPRHFRIAAIFPQELEYSGRLLQGATAYASEHRHITLVHLPFSVDAPWQTPFDEGKPPFDAAVVWASWLAYGCDGQAASMAEGQPLPLADMLRSLIGSGLTGAAFKTLWTGSGDRTCLLGQLSAHTGQVVTLTLSDQLIRLS